MCGAADSEATIKGNTTLEQEKKIRKDAGKAEPTASDSAAAAVAKAQSTLGFSIGPPGAAPDLTDELLRKRRASELTSALTGRGRRDSMLGGGDINRASRTNSILGGY